MSQMLLYGSTVYNNIVQVDLNKWQISQDSVHDTLE